MDTDDRIERSIKNVGAKLADMAAWEKERREAALRQQLARRRQRRFLKIGLPAAASVVVILAIGMNFFISRTPDPMHYGQPTYEAQAFRGASAADTAAIAAMIDAGSYHRALCAIDSAMADTTVIKPEFTPERRNYLLALNADARYELTWLKIRALVAAGRTDEARRLLKTFVDEEGPHQQEARRIKL